MFLVAGISERRVKLVDFDLKMRVVWLDGL